MDLIIEPDRTDETEIGLVLRNDTGLAYRFTFSFETDRFFEPATANEPNVRIISERDEVPLIHYLNDVMPQFYTSDLSFLQGFSFLREPPADARPFDLRTFNAVDWAAANVDIGREFGAGANGQMSVHQYIEQMLTASEASIVYYDHGSGEIADFISFQNENGRLVVRFYHCKGAGAERPGFRLEDCYELLGQVVKSTPLAKWQKVLSGIRRRFTGNIGSHRFMKGTLRDLDTLLNATSASQIDFEFVAVQPGLAREGIPAPISNLLASASDYLVRGGFRPLAILGSLAR